MLTRVVKVEKEFGIPGVEIGDNENFGSDNDDDAPLAQLVTGGRQRLGDPESIACIDSHSDKDVSTAVRNSVSTARYMKTKKRKTSEDVVLNCFRQSDLDAIGAPVHQDCISTSNDDVKMDSYTLFKQVFDSGTLAYLSDQANQSSLQQSGTSANVSATEIEQYIGLIILMSIVQMPSLRDYWSSSLRYEKIASVMSRERFEDIRRWLRFNESSVPVDRDETVFDDLYKLLLRRAEAQARCEPSYSLKDCLVALSDALCRSGKLADPGPGLDTSGENQRKQPKKRDRREARTNPPSSAIRYDNVGHLSESVKSSYAHKCKLCFATKRGQTRVRCIKCGVFLCQLPHRNCFIKFHTK